MSQLVHRKDIDGLRGIALIIGLIFHYFQDFNFNGFHGADLFFVISGYLITQIIQENWQREDFFSWFYIRRIRRLFPTLIVTLYATLILGGIFLLSAEFDNLLRHLAASATFSSNILLASEISYFKDLSNNWPLLHLWSLAVEEQFYLFWPLLVCLCLRFRVKLWIPMLIIFALSLNYFMREFYFQAKLPYFDSRSRIWGLVVGAFLSQIPIRSYRGMSLIGFSMLTFTLFRPRSDIPELSFLLASIGTAMIIMGGEDGWVNRHILSQKCLMWLGLVSYPVYLWHWPLISIVRITREHEPSDMFKWGLLFFSIFIGWLTTKYIEAPIRSRPLSKKGALIMASPMFLLLLLGAVPHLRNFKIAWDRSGYAPEYEGKGVELLKKACDIQSKFLEYKCEVYDPKRAPTVVLYGESSADRYYPGLSQVLARQGENVMNLYRSSCVPFLDMHLQNGPSKVCSETTARAIDYIMNEPSIHTIYFSHRFLIRDFVLKSDPRPTYLENYEIALTKTLELFHTKKKVVFYYGLPELPYDVSQCLNTKFALGRSGKDCKIPTKAFFKKIKKFVPVLERVFAKFPQMEVIRLYKYMCNENFCNFKVDNNLLYEDSVHLSPYGSLYLTEKYFNEKGLNQR